jgi:signal transduction histidine kinase
MTDRGQGGSGCSKGTTAEQVEGAGLGLVLSHKLIERHGSKMWVKSQVGAGIDVWEEFRGRAARTVASSSNKV